MATSVQAELTKDTVGCMRLNNFNKLMHAAKTKDLKMIQFLINNQKCFVLKDGLEIHPTGIENKSRGWRKVTFIVAENESHDIYVQYK